MTSTLDKIKAVKPVSMELNKLYLDGFFDCHKQIVQMLESAKQRQVTADRSQRRVVCAAIRDTLGRIITSARHYDPLMHELIPWVGGDWKLAEQGFIDQWGKFMTREEAFEVATAGGQILKKTGNPDSKELFSEDLY